MKAGRFRVGIIGAGRVGPVIGRALQLVGHEIIGITRSSNPERNDAAEAILGVPVIEPDEACQAELVVIAIPDDQIEPLIQGLAILGCFRPGQVVMHTSGVHGINVLEAAQAAGALPIALHPAMTFTGTSLDVERLQMCPAAITATAVALPIASALAMEMGMEPCVVEEEDRTLYHAGLTHGANHLVTLVNEALSILEAAGIENPELYIRPLLNAALERALSEGAHGLTGPVRRADTGTLKDHQKALSEAGLNSILESYRNMARTTAHLAGDNLLLGENQVQAVLRALGEE
ncbi:MULTISPECIES: Rossmann-like and DUF2520 domain-containing protein [unclassified Actinomyces]|uniref:Rossmann-like and DUF2520 domain-containing protein n=1 Tax=unclassified Actinomyces TaxID=2609248 RepID=UPI0008A400AC|nr:MULTISPECIES: DUF2520 domain-containing protein [unclassified Actinomyces]MDU5232278.1 DUF2520 domain-containing protein [Actinomyces sp.]MDU6680012.1 DUF2520 domain-containing protein [Actinomyces sp.]MDU6757717.1 DUF2520 domain-containing protein [Actinomyces sp.]OFJ61860.1 F420-dependent NADP oxidoreductase [Actinomyces sp. HMSC075B09]